jgi:hypothetical protein
MSRLSKDQIQKFLLSLIGLATLVYCYWTFFLGPLDQSQTKMKLATADREDKLARGAKTLKEAARLEETARDSIPRSAKLQELTPPGAPLAWFPPLIKSFFAADQIELGLVRLLNTTAFKQPEMAAYSKTDWAIEIPRADFLVLGGSIARLENERLFSSVTNIRIHAVPEEPEIQTVTLGLTRIVKQ